MAAQRRGRWLIVAGGALAAAGAGLFAWLRRPQKAPDHPMPYVRDAGPAEQPDEDGSNWDRVDESSDESFPASDPPSIP